METISDSSLDLLIGTYQSLTQGQHNIHTKWLLSALNELKKRRGEDKEIVELKHRMAGLEK